MTGPDAPPALRPAFARLVDFCWFVLRRLGRRRALSLSVLLLLAGLSEGVALLLLLPLLQLLEAGADPTASAPYHEHALQLFSIRPTLPGVLLIFFCVATIRAWLVRQQAVALLRSELELTRAVRIDLYSAIARASWAFLRIRRSSEFMASLTAETGRMARAIHFALEAPARAIMIAIYISIAFLIAPTMSAAALAAGAGLFWLSKRYLAESLALGERLTRSFRALQHQMTEFLAGLKVTKIFGAHERHIEAFANALAGVDRDMAAYARSAANARLMQDVLAAAVVIAFLWAGYAMWELPIAELLVLAAVLFRLLPLMQSLQLAAQELLHNADAAAAVQQTIDEARRAEEPRSARMARCYQHPVGVVLDNVVFRYGQHSKAVLAGVSLQLSPGSLTVLAGPSGVGKSTLLDLMCGLLQPAAGTIAVDGRALAEADLPAWRQSVAYVAQESFLFDDTIRANLLIGAPDASEQSLHDALARAGASALIAAHPHGLDRIVGASGSALSGGERQRLAIARALLRNPALLIMDEPASALDRAHEGTINDTIAGLRGAVTVIVATHRPERLITAADQFLTLQDGRIRPAPG